MGLDVTWGGSLGGSSVSGVSLGGQLLVWGSLWCHLEGTCGSGGLLVVAVAGLGVTCGQLCVLGDTWEAVVGLESHLGNLGGTFGSIGVTMGGSCGFRCSRGVHLGGSCGSGVSHGRQLLAWGITSWTLGAQFWV